MLAEHRIDDSDESLVAVEESVTTGQQIAFEPAFALVLAQHRVEHSPLRRKELVVAELPPVPLTVSHFEDCLQEIRYGLIRSEEAEVPLVLVQLGDVAQERAQHQRVLDLNRSR